MENTENKMTAEQIFNSKSTAQLKQEAIAAVHAWNPNIQLTKQTKLSAHFLVDDKFTLKIEVKGSFKYFLVNTDWTEGEWDSVLFRPFDKIYEVKVDQIFKDIENALYGRYHKLELPI